MEYFGFLSGQIVSSSRLQSRLGLAITHTVSGSDLKRISQVEAELSVRMGEYPRGDTNCISNNSYISSTVVYISE